MYLRYISKVSSTCLVLSAKLYLTKRSSNSASSVSHFAEKSLTASLPFNESKKSLTSGFLCAIMASFRSFGVSLGKSYSEKPWDIIHLGSLYIFHRLEQAGASDHSLGFEDENFGSSPGWWAATVATYCPSRSGELPKFLSSKPCE